MCWESNLGPLTEQSVLLTIMPSLQILHFLFFPMFFLEDNQ